MPPQIHVVVCCRPLDSCLEEMVFAGHRRAVMRWYLWGVSGDRLIRTFDRLTLFPDSFQDSSFVFKTLLSWIVVDAGHEQAVMRFFSGACLDRDSECICVRSVLTLF